MHERRLDEEIAADGRVVEEAVRPLDVGLHAGSDLAAEEGDAGGEDVEAGVAVQGLGLQGEGGGQRSSASMRATRGARAAARAVLRAATSPPAPGARSAAAVVGRGVPPGEGAVPSVEPSSTANTSWSSRVCRRSAEALPESGLGVSDREQDADPRRGRLHSWRFTKARAARTAASAEAASTT